MTVIFKRHWLALGMAFQLAMAPVLAEAVTSSAPPKAVQTETLFGPKKYFAQFFPRAQSDSFNVSNPTLSPGRLVITNGVGSVPLPKVCPRRDSRNFFAVLECEIDNAFRTIRAKLTQVDRLEVTFNGQPIVTERHFDHCTNQLVFSVSLKSSNQIVVKAEGFPSSYVTVLVDRTVSANQAPLAAFTITPGPVTDPLVYKFDGSASKDPDGSIAAWNYDFGDGQTATGSIVSHKYAAVGSYKVTLTVTDNKSAQNSLVLPVVVQDTRAPLITIAAPLEGANFTTGTVAVSGSSDEPLSLATVNGQDLVLSADHRSFGGSITLTSSGAQTLTIAATDESGNIQTVVRHITLSINRPPVPQLALSGTSGIRPLRVYMDASKSTDPDGDAIGSYTWNFGDGQTGSGAIVTHEYTTVGAFSVALTVADVKGAKASLSASVQVSDPVLPADPSLQAPQIAAAQYTSLGDQISFLYQGANPLQKGVVSGALDSSRPGLVRGRVLDATGIALSGVTVRVLGAPQLGSTTSRADGYFDLALNAGQTVVLSYERSGYLSAQRNVEVVAQSGQVVADVQLLRPDSKVTTVSLGAAAVQGQVASGTQMQDSSGARTLTAVFPSGITADSVLPNGSTVHLNALSFRATEYTVGASGPSRMPGDLPKSSAYTYAVDLTSDEALALGASKVTLSKPVSVYVDNFLNLPVGSAIPLGTFDRTQGLWIPEKDGLVLKVLSVSNGTASVDLKGAGQVASASDLQAWGLSAEELALLGSKYAAGTSLWRVQVNHFTAFDMNLAAVDRNGDHPFKTPDDNPDCGPCKGVLATSPGPLLAGGPFDNGAPEATTIQGCEINPFVRLFRENISLTGVPAYLNYASNRQPGFTAANSYKMNLITGAPPSGLISVEVTTNVAGRRFTETLTPQADLSYQFTRWDGKDGYGRLLTSPTQAKIEVKFNYPHQYNVCPAQASGPSSFGQPSEPACQVFPSNRTTDTYFYPFYAFIGPQTAAVAGDLGNWSLSNHHFFDPASQTLFLGSGQNVAGSQLGFRVSTIAGTGVSASSGDGGPALQASLIKPRGLAQAADGSIFVVDDCCTIRKISPSGIITRYAGTGVSGFGGNGGPALQATFGKLSRPALKPDGTLIFTDPPNNVIWAIDPVSGIAKVIAGQPQVAGVPVDGQLASAAFLNTPQAPMLASDGSLYFPDGGSNKLMRIDPAGILHTVAGTGVAGYSGDGGSALQAQLNDPAFCVEDASGAIYIADRGNQVIRKLSPNGVISLFAGTPTVKGKPTANDTLLTAKFNFPTDIVLNNHEEFFVIDQSNNVVREITPDGRVVVAVGGGTNVGVSGTLAGPLVALNTPSNILWDPVSDSLILSDNGNALLRRISFSWQNAAGGGFNVASLDGNEIYTFGSSGQHLTTRSALTGQTLMSFAYDAGQHLTAMTDAYGAVSTLARDASGRVSQITGPDGYVNQVQVAGDGTLTAVTLPLGERTLVTYAAGGLMSSYQKPAGQTDSYSFDSVGQLVSETNLGGGSKNFSANGDSVQITDSLGRVQKYRRFANNSGGTSFEVTDPAGLITTRSINSRGQHTVAYPDGTVTTSQTAFDPVTASSLITTAESSSGFAGQAYSPSLVRTVTGSLNGAFQVQNKWKAFTRVQTEVYDSQTRTRTSTSGLGESSALQTDAFGNLIQVKAGNFTPVNMSYDSRGRLSLVAQGPRQTSFSYNAKGDLASVVDPLGQATTFGYDLSGRQTSITYQDGRVVKLGYNANAELASLQTPLGAIHQMLYNALDLLGQYAAPIVGSTDGHLSYSYNSERQLTSIARADSRTESASYDSQTARLKTLGDSLTSTSVNYDSAGRVSQILSTSGIGIGKTYQGPNLLSRTYTGAAVASVNYAWLTKNLLASESVNGSSFSYSYSADERLSAIGALTLNRDTASGLISGVSLGQVSSALSYSSFGELASLQTSFGGSGLFSETFTRDDLGRISAKTEVVSGVSSLFNYSYDIAGRLVQVRKNGSVVSTYSYDANGNRLSAVTSASSKSATYDAQDRLISYGSSTYFYDGNGTLTSKQNAQTATTSFYSTDIFGQLTSVQFNPTTKVDYLNDGENRRVLTKLNGQIQQQLIFGDRLHPVAAIDSSGVLAHFGYASQAHSPDFMTKGSVSYYFVKDHLGSIRMVVNSATGMIAQQMDYDEFGNVIQDTNPEFQPFGFAGGLHDPSTGMVRFGARTYDPETGRWTSKDPILFNGGDTNLYGYVLNDPVNFKDPDGLITEGAVAEHTSPNQQLGFGVAEAAAGAACMKAGVSTADLPLLLIGVGLGYDGGRNILKAKERGAPELPSLE